MLLKAQLTRSSVWSTSKSGVQKQNSNLLSLLPQSHNWSTNPPPSPTTNEPKDPPDTAQLLAELVDLKRENQALRYTFLGESLLPPVIKSEPTEDVSGPKPTPTPTFALPTKPEPGLSPSSSTLTRPQQALTDQVDLKAVLNKVQALFRENEELTGLLVGEMRVGGDAGSLVGMGSWLGVIDGERGLRWMWAGGFGKEELM